MLKPISAPSQPQRTDQLRQKSAELESAFLSEMLRHAGSKGQSGDFSGGIGEEQFSSFLTREHANAIVARGGLGLQSVFMAALQEKESSSDQ